MPIIATILLPALGLGMAYAAAPGAVNTEAVRRGVAHGARATLLVEAGSLLGDVLWALIALTGISVFARHLAIQVALGIVGGCFLLRMAWLALHEALRRQPDGSAVSPSARGHLATGLVFGVANPVGLAFWSGLGASVVATGATGQGLALFVVSFLVGASLWCAGLSAAMRWGRRWVRPSLFRWINALCGLAFGYLGLRILWETAHPFIERGFFGALGIEDRP